MEQVKVFPAVFAVEEQMELLKRVDQYSKNIAQYKRPTYNETEVRVDFVNPFFKRLPMIMAPPDPKGLRCFPKAITISYAL